MQPLQLIPNVERLAVFDFSNLHLLCTRTYYSIYHFALPQRRVKKLTSPFIQSTNMVPNPVTDIPPGLPRTQTAIVQYEGGILKTTEGVKLPHIPPDRMMVRVIAVALNPCDYKMPYRFPSPGAGNGTDFAGVVVAIGPNIAKIPSFEIGDAVFGAVYGANPIDPESGSFAQYIRADPEFTLRKPESMSWQVAASIGASGIATLGLALFRSLGLPGTPSKPAKQPEQVLVYGGSTSVGTMAIQLLRLYCLKPPLSLTSSGFDLTFS